MIIPSNVAAISATDMARTKSFKANLETGAFESFFEGASLSVEGFAGFWAGRSHVCFLWICAISWIHCGGGWLAPGTAWCHPRTWKMPLKAKNKMDGGEKNA